MRLHVSPRVVLRARFSKARRFLTSTMARRQRLPTDRQVSIGIYCYTYLFMYVYYECMRVTPRSARVTARKPGPRVHAPSWVQEPARAGRWGMVSRICPPHRAATARETRLRTPRAKPLHRPRHHRHRLPTTAGSKTQPSPPQAQPRAVAEPRRALEGELCRQKPRRSRFQAPWLPRARTWRAAAQPALPQPVPT